MNETEGPHALKRARVEYAPAYLGLSRDVLLLILGRAFSTLREARELMCVCPEWHRLSRYRAFWAPYLERQAALEQEPRMPAFPWQLWTTDPIQDETALQICVLRYRLEHSYKSESYVRYACSARDWAAYSHVEFVIGARWWFYGRVDEVVHCGIYRLLRGVCASNDSDGWCFEGRMKEFHPRGHGHGRFSGMWNMQASYEGQVWASHEYWLRASGSGKMTFYDTGNTLEGWFVEDDLIMSPHKTAIYTRDGTRYRVVLPNDAVVRSERALQAYAELVPIE